MVTDLLILFLLLPGGGASTLYCVFEHLFVTPLLQVLELQAQLDQSKRSVTELKRHCRRVTSDLQDARVLTDSLQARAHELDRKQRRSVVSEMSH